MSTSGRTGRRFTSAEEIACLHAILGGRGGASAGRPYLELEIDDKHKRKRPSFVIRRRGLSPIRTGFGAHGGYLAGAELMQARWAWETHASQIPAKLN